MAYSTGSATDATDLMSKLSTFAQANGFTEDYYNGTNHFLSLSRAAQNIYVSFQWDLVNTIAMYQALGYSGTYDEEPWNQANDSGNGQSDFGAYPDRGRQVSQIGAGPFTAYHFFAYDDPYAIHVVLEFSPGLYRHFGFGYLAKAGTWTGGAWCAGHLWSFDGSTPFNVYADPTSYHHTVLLDGILRPQVSVYYQSTRDAGGTLHCEGLNNQPSGGKWGHAVANTADDDKVGTDRAAVQRIRIGGGCRRGPALSQFGYFLPNLANGFIPIIPMEVFYNEADNSADGWWYLGRVANIGHIHLHGIDPAQELTVGAEIWIAFPMVRKSNVGGFNQESENAGIIYRKNA